MAAPLFALESQAETARDVPPQLVRALAGRFVVTRRISSSAMSDVYLARQAGSGREVAIKVMNPVAARDLEERGRFAREARTQAALAHPAIVKLSEHVESGPLPYFVMAYVEGGSLEGWSAARADVAKACAILADVALALDCAHRAGVLHRDVKPSNILVDARTGRGLLTDFGVAIVSTSDHSRSEMSRRMGTPGYMAPEQILGEQDADGRADLYSLGVVAFELFAGRLPYEGENEDVVAARQIGQDAPPLESLVPGIPAHVAAAVDKCLAREPGKRWADGKALARALTGPDKPAGRGRSVAMSGLLGLLLAFGFRA